MVIGVEPLAHGQRREVVPSGFGAARQCEVKREVGQTAAFEAARHAAQHQGGIQHAVIERKVAYRTVVEAVLGVTGIVVEPHRAAALLQLGRIRLAGPVALQG